MEDKNKIRNGTALDIVLGWGGRREWTIRCTHGIRVGQEGVLGRVFEGKDLEGPEIIGLG